MKLSIVMVSNNFKKRINLTFNPLPPPFFFLPPTAPSLLFYYFNTAWCCLPHSPVFWFFDNCQTNKSKQNLSLYCWRKGKKEKEKVLNNWHTCAQNVSSRSTLCCLTVTHTDIFHLKVLHHKRSAYIYIYICMRHASPACHHAICLPSATNMRLQLTLASDYLIMSLVYS